MLEVGDPLTERLAAQGVVARPDERGLAGGGLAVAEAEDAPEAPIDTGAEDAPEEKE